MLGDCEPPEGSDANESVLQPSPTLTCTAVMLLQTRFSRLLIHDKNKMIALQILNRNASFVWQDQLRCRDREKVHLCLMAVQTVDRRDKYSWLKRSKSEAKFWVLIYFIYRKRVSIWSLAPAVHIYVYEWCWHLSDCMTEDVLAKFNIVKTFTAFYLQKKKNLFYLSQKPCEDSLYQVH